MRTFKRLVAIFVVCLVLVSLIGCKGQAKKSFVRNTTMHFDEEDNIKELTVYINDTINEVYMVYAEATKKYHISTRSMSIGTIETEEFDIFIYYRGETCSVLVETNDQEFYIFNATIVVKKGK